MQKDFFNHLVRYGVHKRMGDEPSWNVRMFLKKRFLLNLSGDCEWPSSLTVNIVVDSMTQRTSRRARLNTRPRIRPGRKKLCSSFMDKPEPTIEDRLLRLQTESLSREDFDYEWEFIWKEYRQQIFQRCFRWMRNRQDAEDITQETFTRAFKNISKLDLLGDREKAFNAWLRTVANRCCLSALKRKSR